MVREPDLFVPCVQFDGLSVAGDREHKAEPQVGTFAEPAVECMREVAGDFAGGIALSEIDADPATHVQLIDADSRCAGSCWGAGTGR